MKKLRVTVDGKVYEVSVELLDDPAAATQPQARPVQIAGVAPVVAPSAVPPAPESAAPPSAGPAGIPSPLSGKIVSLDVAVGQQVAQGAQLITIEAMKMNTFVYAPRAGRVTAIHVRPGDAVEEGAALLTVD